MTVKLLRFISRALTALLLVGVIGAKPLAPESVSRKSKAGPGNGLIVHEWGTFTSVAGKDGVAVEWRPLNGKNDLPTFVYDMSGLATGTGLRNGRQCVKCDMEAVVRMETPVIYFYTERETTVSVRVDFLQGKITEWYPQARSAYVPAAADAWAPSTIDWGRITVIPGSEERFPVEAQPSHYYPARETDAAPLRVCGSKGEQREKFLFYRGVGKFDPPLTAKLDDGSVVVRNTGGQTVPQVILFENYRGKIGYRFYDSVQTELARPPLNQTVGSLEQDL
ncbi:MAG: hypothetical protein WAV47_12490, partial [Blastocatellia bacterium]